MPLGVVTRLDNDSLGVQGVAGSNLRTGVLLSVEYNACVRRGLGGLRERENRELPTMQENDLLEPVQEVAHGVSFDVSFSLLRSDFSSRGTTPTAQNTA